MPWRDDIEINAVEYSDRPKANGPAPDGDEIECGQIAELTARDGDREFAVELQFWRELEANVDIERPTDSAAGYMAWRIGNQQGRYGVFDGHAERVWFGMETFTDGEREYAFVDVGEDWREKIYWNDFFDRIYGGKLQYPAIQVGDIAATAADSLVDHSGPKTEVYEISTEEFGEEAPYQFQAWRPTTGQAVFFAVKATDNEVWQAERGVLDRAGILSDMGSALSLDDETIEQVYEMTTDLRDDDLDGLQV